MSSEAGPSSLDVSKTDRIQLEDDVMAGVRPGFRYIEVSGCACINKNEDNQKQGFTSNVIRTARYQWWNFICKNLVEQFSNPSNIYFLLIGLLQIYPKTSTTLFGTLGFPSMYQPLAFIVVVSGVRALTEDLQRHKSDRERNRSCYKVLHQAGFEDEESGKLRVGDIVKVMKNKMIPADMLFLGSALDKGHAFIDKANLNGETKLEVVSCIPETKDACETVAGLKGLAMTLMYEPPNHRFEAFQGDLYVRAADGTEQRVVLDQKMLLMQETNLRNCDYIIGLVVYTGMDTKIQQSTLLSGKNKLKKSKIMRTVDFLLRGTLLTQILLCALAGIVLGIWLTNNNPWYLTFDRTDGPFILALYSFGSWFILLSNMVPISLTVTSEMVKFAMSFFIVYDLSLYDTNTQKHAKCNNSTIHEDLGAIDYIFSDKTGTLTQNKMQFRYAMLPERSYGSKQTEIAKSVQRRRQLLENPDTVTKPNKTWSLLNGPLIAEPRERKVFTGCFGWVARTCWERPRWKLDEEIRINQEATESLVENNKFNDADRRLVLDTLYGGEASEETCQELSRFLVHMALSNTVKPWEDNGVLKFQAESAEEHAMVQLAQSLGYTKLSQNPTVLQVQPGVEGEGEVVKHVYNHVATLGFTSKRARVSVIYERMADHKIVVMTKGQDTVMLPLLKDTPNEEVLLTKLEELASNGLRTLMCAEAILEKEWWSERQEEFIAVTKLDDSLENVKRTHDFFERIELDAGLSYLGCMGLEDQLQLLVPDAIQDFLAAQIRVWMITGDKLEAAKNIGIACNLIDPDMQPTFKAGDSVEDAVKQIAESRLLEITGQWAAVAHSPDELSILFDTFTTGDNEDLDKRKLDFDRMAATLKALQFNVDTAVLRKLFDAADRDHDGAVVESEFITVMQSFKLSPFQAVRNDLLHAWQRYERIEDHDLYPVSIVINREAFHVMFPAKVYDANPLKKRATRTTETVQGVDQEVPEEELEKLRSDFFLLASKAKSVVFARAEPAMKKRMVTEVMKREPGVTTLAIGDGANDAEMIRAANLGVGIAGIEGTAAVNAADYAIGSFRMLHTLLFVHGFWCYQRIAFMTNFLFYKAALVGVITYCFGIHGAFSGQQFFPDQPYLYYAVMFTALPVIAVGIFEKPLNRRTLEDNPIVYHASKGKAFNPGVFVGWSLRSVVHGILVFYTSALCHGLMSVSGSESEHWYFATEVYYTTTFLVTFVIIFDMTSVTVLHLITLIISVFALVVFLLILNTIPSMAYFHGLVDRLYTEIMPWLIIVINVSIPLLMELGFRGWKMMVRPSLVQVLSERIHKMRSLKKGDPRKRGVTVAVQLSNKRKLTEVKLDTGVQAAWETRQKAKPKARKLKEAALKRLPTVLQSAKEQDAEEHQRQAIIVSMLRFKNLTGSHFESAARAKYQEHDTLSPQGSSRRKLADEDAEGAE